jgi:hypothetical protein
MIKFLKYIFNLFISFSFLIISNKLFSQSKKATRDVQEIKMIFRDATSKNLKSSYFSLVNDSLILPSYFTSYKIFFDKKTKFDKINLPDFEPTNKFKINLTKSDCHVLNSSMLNDSIELKILPSWFVDYKIIVLSDSITKTEKYIGKLMKPIFFRNFTRCFIAILNNSGMETFFLKKNNNHWVFDKSYIMIDYD